MFTFDFHIIILICSETRFYGYDAETKKYNAAGHRDRIMGKHVSEYMKSLKEADEESYKRQFSAFLKAGIDGTKVIVRFEFIYCSVFLFDVFKLSLSFKKI